VSIRIDQMRSALQHFDFKDLFVEELGWDHHSGLLDVHVNGVTYRLKGIAQKRGMAVYLCPTPPDQDIPDYAARRKIERQVTKTCHEHFIIYFDINQTHQIWQWVKREPGKPNACREHSYRCGQTGEALAQRLSNIAFTLEEEEDLTVVTVAGRAQAAFDVERVTRRFYDYFKDEHTSFLKFLEGIPDEQMKHWYISVMLNRLMFIYFIQKKGFLDEDRNYLRNKLAQNGNHGKNAFYREFLCPLFFEGFAKRPQNRSAKTNRLLGKVPYLNGGLFLRHQIEELHGEKIQIPDSVFERIFDFFDRYRWHLDERPLRHDDEINPDVLGYIFEKYINQKQMGAYYTKEDITGYISRNTIIPFLFDAAEKECKVAFESGQYIWKLLQVDPDRYIYPAVHHGITCNVRETPSTSLEQPLPLPPEIEAGINDVSKRAEWNKTAAAEVGLPTEIWRGVVARRQRYHETRDKLAGGEVHDINDLITLNLDIEQFAQDVIENCEGPELLRAFWHAITRVRVLDPTCGSGAFLFAALNILETLYKASLDRMQAFVDELKLSGEKHRPEKFSDFRMILEQVEKHPSRKYYIYKSIIINNLYGVDIMDEAIEIAKLRLFLKLVAQVDRVEDIEPLPDIDFNIRAGNTLVGYATYDQVRKAVTSKLDFDNAMQRIEEKASDVEHLSALFRQQQTELGGTVTVADKQKLRSRLASLEEDLNHYLASEYKIDATREDEYEEWLTSHKPFHWFIEFYRIIKQGGFEVIIGNPPYVEYSKAKSQYKVHGYATEQCGNLYSFIVERNFDLLSKESRTAMIVAHSAVCTDRMTTVQELLTSEGRQAWISTYAIRPSKLFTGVDQRLAIYLLQRSGGQQNAMLSTNYFRWHEEYRPFLFQAIEYAKLDTVLPSGSIPKIGHTNDQHIWRIIRRFRKLGTEIVPTSARNKVYFHNAPRYWIRAMDFPPYFWNERDGEKLSSHVKVLGFDNTLDADVVTAVLNSSLLYWWFIVHSDCRDLNLREIQSFPLGLEKMPDELKRDLSKAKDALMQDYKQNSQRKKCNYRTTGQVAYDEFFPGKSKAILDQIDDLLAEHYGFDAEELDAIKNYDIKYRLGVNS